MRRMQNLQRSRRPAHSTATARDLLQVRHEMVRRHDIEEVPMAMTAKLFGVSLPTAYQAQAAFAAEGIAGLLPKRRGPKQGHKLTPEILASERPAWRVGATASPEGP